MKCLNEPMARAANKEDGCTGHFWESRFKSDPLLTETALLSCMVYVDLNPIRACMAETPETSDHTSIQERIAPRFNLTEAIQQQLDQEGLSRFEVPIKPLAPFEGDTTDQHQPGIPFCLIDYIELVEYTGRIIRSDKRGAIPNHLPPILQRLNLQQKEWLKNTTAFEQRIYRQLAPSKQAFANTG